jgi:ribonucleoside-diphosphate reductase alpha chain
MYMLLCGAGAGFSVQKHHVEMLPNIAQRKNKAVTYKIPDSIEGWAESVDVLMSSFFEDGGKHPKYKGCHVSFDYSEIRPKGAFICGGFKAPGPEPLRKALGLIEDLLNKAVKEGNKLRPLHCYDICMYAADAVIAGGVRRSATISLFSKDDDEMMKAKTGNWFVDNPQRGRSNNSAMLLRSELKKEELEEMMNSVRQFGEPGWILTDSLEFTFNPLKLAA